MDLIYRYDPHLPIQIDSVTDATSAIKTLCDGNRRLTSLVKQMQQAIYYFQKHTEVRYLMKVFVDRRLAEGMLFAEQLKVMARKILMLFSSKQIL